MIAIDLGVEHVDQAIRLVRALGSHRYVAGRLHLTHALAIASVGDDAGGALAEARTWALAILAREGAGEGERAHERDAIDLGSRDERLWRRGTDAEVAALLEAYWTPGTRSRAARDALREQLARRGLAVDDRVPFDESDEDGIHPMAIDAGWELLGLHELDPERHRGAIGAFGDELAFASARFEEETSVPAPSHLYELPAFGPTELLAAAGDDGRLTQPFVIWAQGHETYLDYVFRGIRRAAKLG
jgi:hypothetical protein